MYYDASHAAGCMASVVIIRRASHNGSAHARRSLSTLASIVLVGMCVAAVPVLTIFLFNDDNSLPHDDSDPLTQPLAAAQKDPGLRAY